MVELDKIAVANRLKEFALEKHGSLKGLADNFKMSYSSFHSAYFNGRSFPGPKILSKLIEMGCNIEWLLHGESRGLIVSEKTVEYHTLLDKNDKLKEENEKLKKQLKEINNLTKV